MSGVIHIIRKPVKNQGWFTTDLDEYLSNKSAAGSLYQRKRTIRPSEIGYCTRKIVMSILNLLHEEPVTPQQQRVFDNGNWVHKRYLKGYIPSLGCAATVWVEEKGVLVAKPFIEVTIEDKELWIKGAPDAVIINKHDHLPYIFELKSIKQELFNSLIQPSEEYTQQVYLYMYLTGIPRAIVFYENKNNQELLEFKIDLDPVKLQEVLTKIKLIQKYVTEWSLENPALPPKCRSSYCGACK